jgi:hypothetical protein
VLNVGPWTVAERMVALVIADHLGKKTEAWPGIDRIADRTNLSEKTVRRAAAAICKPGRKQLFRRERRWTRNGSRAYTYAVAVQAVKTTGCTGPAPVLGKVEPSGSPDRSLSEPTGNPDRSQPVKEGLQQPVILTGESVHRESVHVESDQGGKERDSHPPKSRNGRRPITDATATAIERLAREASNSTGGQESPEGFILEASRIPASESYPETTFTDPRRRGISEEWGQTTLAKLKTMHNEARRVSFLPD